MAGASDARTGRPAMTGVKPERFETRVLKLKQVSTSCYELVLERRGLEFQAGHEIMLHGEKATDDRQYSIATGENDEQLGVFFRLIEEGALTPQLVRWAAGDPVAFTGPFGSFLIRDFLAPMVFIATGTGIAPALCFARSHAGLDLTVFHGVRVAEDLVAEPTRTDLFGERYVPCISREKGTGFFEGRVTACLPDQEFPEGAHFYLCGANDMILEVRQQLRERGIEDARIFSEAYYFW